MATPLSAGEGVLVLLGEVPNAQSGSAARNIDVAALRASAPLEAFSLFLRFVRLTFLALPFPTLFKPRMLGCPHRCSGLFSLELDMGDRGARALGLSMPGCMYADAFAERTPFLTPGVVRRGSGDSIILLCVAARVRVCEAACDEAALKMFMWKIR